MSLLQIMDSYEASLLAVEELEEDMEEATDELQRLNRIVSEVEIRLSLDLVVIQYLCGVILSLLIIR
jgi:wobble nucleotide-excising tRNase